MHEPSDTSITHVLKCVEPYFSAIFRRQKSFEIRQNVDRNFKEGDVLVLEQWDEPSQKYTGQVQVFRVGYILKDFVGLAPGYVAMELKKFDNIFDY